MVHRVIQWTLTTETDKINESTSDDYSECTASLEANNTVILPPSVCNIWLTGESFTRWKLKLVWSSRVRCEILEIVHPTVGCHLDQSTT